MGAVGGVLRWGERSNTRREKIHRRIEWDGKFFSTRGESTVVGAGLWLLSQSSSQA